MPAPARERRPLLINPWEPPMIIGPAEYYKATCRLAELVRQDFAPDYIIPIGGGMVPGWIPQEELGVKARCIDIERDGTRRTITYGLAMDVGGRTFCCLKT
jgi:hypoxanthine phosphoribosyltransferase